MQRRPFIRILGGGAVLATTALSATASGCSSEMPADAITAWQGPKAETDQRRWVLAHAILAPHSHNLQSWLVDLSQPGEMRLFCDTTRLLPQTDPANRQILMSQGTFLELLDLAARERGHRAKIQLFPDGVFEGTRPDARPIAHIRLVADAQEPKDPLFGHIFKRHTHKGLYDAARPVPAQAWAAMAAAMAGAPGLRFGHLPHGEAKALQAHRAIANEAWRIELSTPHTMLESLKVLRVGAREISQHRDGISLLDPMVVALTRLGLFDRSKAPLADDMSVTGQIRDFAKNLESTPGFLWIVSADNSRHTQIAAGRAYARVQLAATAQAVVMQPLSQALQEFAEVAGPYRAIHNLLAPAGGTVQMWARVGHPGGAGRHAGPAPRRGLDAIIRA